MIEWQWAEFGQLTAGDLYQVMKLRQQVFVVEQHCIYEDLDDLDEGAWHLIGWRVETGGSRTIDAYLRVLGPGVRYKEFSMGRIVVSQGARGTGLGKELVAKGISLISEKLSGNAIRISAQHHLEGFYSEYGFERISEPYDEDGILHIEMLKGTY